MKVIDDCYHKISILAGAAANKMTVYITRQGEQFMSTSKKTFQNLDV
jgi:hypothetical protein